MIALFLLSCLPQPSLTPATEPASTRTPTIEGVKLSCLNDEWNIEVNATSWTGNGRWWIGVTETTIEEHPIYSVGAPADGSADTLYSSLISIADWRDIVAGESTRWFCNDLEQISIAVAIFEGAAGRTNQLADCVEIGEDLWTAPRERGRLPEACQIWESWDSDEE